MQLGKSPQGAGGTRCKVPLVGERQSLACYFQRAGQWGRGQLGLTPAVTLHMSTNPWACWAGSGPPAAASQKVAEAGTGLWGPSVSPGGALWPGGLS